MTMQHELWFTSLLNKLFGCAVNALLAKIAAVPGFEQVRPADAGAAHPIPDYIAMEILVILVILAAAWYLRTRLSVENPGAFQHRDLESPQLASITLHESDSARP